jgi:Reverse transcriptase (RNA-dependent DNA polymerase)
MPRGRRCVCCKWVFDIKRNGVFRARLVACGYSQIPGVDFTEAYSPLINDVTFRTLLLIQLIFGLCAWLLDVQVAFLHGDLDELIYMFCPEGMPRETDEVLLL